MKTVILTPCSLHNPLRPISRANSVKPVRPIAHMQPRIRFQNLNATQRRFLLVLPHYFMRSFYEGGSLVDPFLCIEERHELISLQFGAILGEIPAEDRTAVLDCLSLKRRDETQSLTKSEFSQQLYLEILEKLRIIDAPEFQQVINPTL